MSTAVKEREIILQERPIIAAPLEKTDKRLTVMEAFEAIIANSAITRCAQEGTYDGWIDAIAKDSGEINDFLNHLVADLSYVSGERIYLQKAFGFSTASGSYETVEARIKAIAQNVRSEFQESLFAVLDTFVNQDKIVSYFSGKGVRKTLPIGMIRWSCNKQIVDFSIGDGFDTTSDVRYAHPSYKSPDDFTRRIPRCAKNKLARLQKTHFNYTPKILDGALVKLSSRSLPHPVFDPAIAMCIDGNHDLVVYFWTEPFNDAKEWAWNHVNGFANVGMASVGIAALCLASLSFWTWAFLAVAPAVGLIIQFFRGIARRTAFKINLKR